MIQSVPSAQSSISVLFFLKVFLLVADKWRLTAQLKQRDGFVVNVGRFLTFSMLA